MEFGAIDHLDRQDRPISETYDSRLKLIELYDKAGFSTFHVTEHHFTPLGLAPSPMIFLAAASRITKNIRFAPLVLIATLYHPLRLVQEICMMDHLTNGRFEIGTGRGVSSVELGFYNITENEAAALYAETMEVLMAALTKDVLNHQGRHFSFKNVPMEMKTLQQPHPPLWYATNSPESAARAARQNVNLVTLLPSKEARAVVDSYKEAWNAAHGGSGKKTPKVGVTRHFYVGDTDQHAKERGAFGARKFYESLVYLWRQFNATHVTLDDVLRSSEATLYTGTPATIRTLVQEDLEVSGANYYVPRFAYGNLTHEESVRSLELFTREVMPHFQK